MCGGCIRAKGSRGRWVLFLERMVFVQTFLQVLQVNVPVALDTSQVCMTGKVLCFAYRFFFRPVGDHRCAYLVKAREPGVFLLECLQ